MTMKLTELQWLLSNALVTSTPELRKLLLKDLNEALCLPPNELETGPRHEMADDPLSTYITLEQIEQH